MGSSLARINVPDSETKRLMIYDSGCDVYLYGYKLMEDSNANWDEWFEDITEAKETCVIKYLVKSSDWQAIPDPFSDCQHDWINPVR